MSLFPLEFEQDGVDHINIYSKGNTELGRLLSNFAHTPIRLTHGTFESIEGFWYWLGSNDDNLKSLFGFSAKRYGETAKVVYEIPDAMFKNFIKDALKAKLEQTPGLKDMLKESSLPFTHYYVFDGVKKEAGYKWIVDYWEELRCNLKN